MNKPAIVLLTNIPTPYRVPLFNVLAKQLASKGKRLHVGFFAAGYSRRQWTDVLAEARFDYEVLEAKPLRLSYEKTIFLPAKVAPLLKQQCPECIIVGGYNPNALRAASWARRHRVPYIVWSGETEREYSFERLRSLKTFLRRRLIRRASAAVAYGSEARRYLRGLGVEGQHIFTAINCIDTTFFREETDRIRASQTGEPRADSPVRLLFVGHLQKRKGLDNIIESLRNLHDWQLDVVGDGPYLDDLIQLAKQSGLEDRIVFHGFRQKSELPAFYAAADIFLFPSKRELFGLVMVEAAAAGLPIAASVLAGGTPDVVAEGENGTIIDPENVAETAQKLDRLLRDPALRTRMGHASRQRVLDQLNIENSAMGFVQAIAHATGDGGQ